MNLKQQRLNQFSGLFAPAVRWRGRLLSIAEASALAVRECQLGNFPAAAEIYRLILAKAPDYAEGHNNLGVAWQQMQRYEEALASYDKAVALKPEYANALYNRGFTLKKMNRREEALASYEQVIALKPDHVEALNNRGVILQELRRYKEALASYDQVLAVKPNHVEALNNRGLVLVSLGDMPEAEKMFLQTLELKPDFPDAVFNLAQIREHQNAESAEVKRIQGLLHKPGLPPDDQEQLYFTLGKIYDDCDHYDEAFECFRQANLARNHRVSYRSEEVAQKINDIIAVFSADFLSRPLAFASDSRTPLFIVGMPRSGTTLLANMLSNHPAIASAGELKTLDELAAGLTELTEMRRPYPQAARQITPVVAARLIRDYEQRLRRDTGPDVPQVIDKNPLNFRHLGFITRLFPKARIIHCTRSPLDTSISNYFQRFPLTIDYAFDLRNIGHFYVEYARLMDHWRKIPGLNWIEVSYESMILETEQTARQLLAFLELDWDEACLRPHTNPGVVETASQWQVRQPIYTHSLERWRHYEKHLAPLKEILRSGGLIPV